MTLNRFLTLVLMVVAAVFAPSANATLLVNGSFEVPVVPTADYVNIVSGAEPTGFGWTVDVNNVDVFSQGVLGATGTIYDGTQALDLVGFGTTGKVSQTFATTIGQLYVLSFAYSNNPISTGGASADVVMTSGLSTVLSQSISHSTATTTDFTWSVFTMNFIAAGTSSTLNFNNTVGANNGGVLLDAVSVEAGRVTAPEPGTFALMLPALAVAVAKLRRK
jgi:hypothetical protein